MRVHGLLLLLVSTAYAYLGSEIPEDPCVKQNLVLECWTCNIESYSKCKSSPDSGFVACQPGETCAVYEPVWSKGAPKIRACLPVNMCGKGGEYYQAHYCAVGTKDLMYRCAAPATTTTSKAATNATTAESHDITKPESQPAPFVIDEDGESDDDSYFATKPEPHPTPKPKPLGMEDGVIPDTAISGSSVDENGYTAARPSSNSGWMPESYSKPYLQIDLGAVEEVHGFGTLGHAAKACWASKYLVQHSTDGSTFSTLMIRGTTDDKTRIFIGNKDQTTWKRHCTHRYYGSALNTRYIRFYPLTDSKGNNMTGTSAADELSGCMAMRVEIYGFRKADDNHLVIALSEDAWTKSTTGCACYLDPDRTDCACCYPGGCQCPWSNKHQCVQCGYGSKCGIPENNQLLAQVDPWTKSMNGCQCLFDPSLYDCACCQNMGCQCGEGNKNQCVQCGQPDHCGQKEEIFGPNQHCEPKTCP